MVARGRAISCLGVRAKELAFQETCTPEMNTEATSELRLQDNEGIETSPPDALQGTCLGCVFVQNTPPPPTSPKRPGGPRPGRKHMWTGRWSVDASEWPRRSSSTVQKAKEMEPWPEGSHLLRPHSVTCSCFPYTCKFSNTKSLCRQNTA